VYMRAFLSFCRLSGFETLASKVNHRLDRHDFSSANWSKDKRMDPLLLAGNRENHIPRIELAALHT